MSVPAYAPLLKTKITLPPPRPQLVPRPRLLQRLQEGLTRPLTLISAPAGFGKTTLVSSWLHEVGDRSRVAWLALDEDDNDPVHFLYYLVAALQTVEPGVGRAPISLLGSLRMPAPKDLMTLLLNEIADSPERIVLVLNDYHVIQNPEIDAALAFFVDHAPERLRLVVATREEPSLPLARWRSLERLSEIGLEDLRFSFDEAALFLKQTMGLELDAESARALEARTEGWIAGLQMAALSLQHHVRTDGVDHLTQVVATFSGGHRYVIDYLAAEVLCRQPEDIHAFLQQTAILDRLCAPLCDAVTGRTDSKAILARLEQANMFLLRLDDHRQWYRYHPLFADFLRTGLDAAEERNLHQKASAWYEAYGFGQEAIKHALAAQDISATVRLFRAQVEDTLSRGEIPTLLVWLEALPDSTVRAHSDLAGYKAWLLYLLGRTAEAQVYSALARVLDHTDAPPAHRGMLLVFQAFLAIHWGDPKQVKRLAQQALEQFGDSTSFFRVYALSFLGQAQALLGERRAAVETFHQAVQLGQKLGNHFVTLDALGHLATLMYAQGQLREAILLCRNAVEQYVDTRGRPLPVAGLVYVPLGVLCYEINDLESARHYLTTGIALCQQLGIIYYTLMGQRALARLQHVCGEREAAWNTLAAARELAERSESRLRRRLVAVVTAELQLREGNVAAAARTLGEAQKDLSSAPEYESLIYARLLLAQRQPSTAENVLGLLEQAAGEEKFEGSLIAIHVLQALCRRALGHRSAALERLKNAVALAASAGYRRVFLDAGPALAALLGQVRPIAPAYVTGLLEGFPHAEKVAPRADTLAEPLSSSQVQILRLLDRGLTNQEIADRLAITIGTTKWHLNQIFGKLQVRNRTEAVAKARELGLL